MARLDAVVGASRIAPVLSEQSADILSGLVQTALDELYSRTALAVEYMRRVVVNVAAAYTPSEEDYLILADATGGAFTVTLPTAIGKQEQVFIVKRVNGGGNNVTIGTTGGETIDGAATVVLAAQWQFRAVISNDANWFVIAQ